MSVGKEKRHDEREERNDIASYIFMTERRARKKHNHYRLIGSFIAAEAMFKNKKNRLCDWVATIVVTSLEHLPVAFPRMPRPSDTHLRNTPLRIVHPHLHDSW